MNFKGKNITVFGLARSGIAAARKLVSLGAKVFVSEIKPEPEIDHELIKELEELKIDIETGGHGPRTIETAELIVVSPGIHLDIPVLERAKQKGIPIISEVELAYQLLSKPIIAVTGTNGKTTTATLIGELLKAGGKKVAVAGNIGAPLVEVNDSDLDYIVAEISSYQLESIAEFKPRISVILNIQPDHLERHGSMAGYIAQKARVFMNQGRDDHVIYNMDDQAVVKMVKKAKAKLEGFSKDKTDILSLSPSEIKIPGRHNLENCLAAAQAAYLCGVPQPVVADVLRNFPGVEHRIEFVASINGVEFYNDSKATNPDATLVALETFEGRGVVLILGGRDKGTTLDALCEKIKAGVKEVVLVGEAASRFKQALQKTGYQKIREAGSLAEAARLALGSAAKGDVALLSPACASFDMFGDFEERGRVFKQAVKELNHA
ncbi:UDP-N-acetylmuramoyl-L-alanine--D-glutamate ligase [Candidatus Margulisiibacteriota bacterium]